MKFVNVGNDEGEKRGVFYNGLVKFVNDGHDEGEKGVYFIMVW